MDQYPYAVVDQGSIGRGFSLNEVLRVPEVLSAKDLSVIVEANKFAFLIQEAYVNGVHYGKENENR